MGVEEKPERMADEKCHYWRGILHNMVVDEMNNILGDAGREYSHPPHPPPSTSLNLPHTHQ
jgi:hypothetical protein